MPINVRVPKGTFTRAPTGGMCDSSDGKKSKVCLKGTGTATEIIGVVIGFAARALPVVAAQAA
ncbi:hypothetical protein GCM10008090_31730 [Arenicella chitinivorans]|uniref:Uncharacterized protein n=1 Tax=Arenicella chitinivorans TaxID=1329800 RepID=A0A918S2C0_9GAMM|nr:hypothetical protein GCM10008090_31730 [Arenicella chitinivorans]